MAFELVLEPPTLERMETKLSKVTVVSYADFRAMIALAYSEPFSVFFFCADFGG